MYDGKIREELSWYAFALCILSKNTPEQSFEILCPRLSAGNGVYTHKDNEDMHTSKQKGATFKEIASIYNLDKAAVFRRVKKINDGERGGRVS